MLKRKEKKRGQAPWDLWYQEKHEPQMEEEEEENQEERQKTGNVNEKRIKDAARFVDFDRKDQLIQ